MKTKTFLIGLLLCIFFPCTLFSQLNVLITQAQPQFIIKGYVNDANGKAISFATIRLLQADSTYIQGTATDSIGHYRFANVQQGKYVLAVSSIGYTSKTYPFTVNQTEQVLPVITLAEDNNLLGEVTIKGQSFIRQKDRVLIIPDKQQLKHSHTGYDVLYNLMIPNIDVDRRKGSVATMGGNVTLYINERKVDYREIQNLRPKDIEKIEYFDAPTGKYSGDIASINYIIKEQQAGGYVALDADQTIGYLKGDYNIATKVTHNNTSYTLFAGHGMQKYEDNDNSKLETFHLTEHSFTRNTIMDIDQTKKSQQYVQLNILNQNSKRTLMGKVSFVHSDSPDNLQNSHLEYSNHYDNAQSKILMDQASLMPTIELYSNIQLRSNQWLECILNGAFTNNTYNRSYTETDFNSHSNVKEKLYTIDPSIKYFISMKHQNSLTIQFQHFHRVSSSSYTGDYQSWQHLWSAETLFFLSYNQNINKKLFLDGRIGMSSLQYRLHDQKRISHISPRGNILIGYKLDDHQQLYAGASVGNAYPEINTINTAEQQIDMLHVKRGNPNLDKVNMYMTSASYNLQFGRFNLFGIFMYSTELNTALPYFYAEDGKVMETFYSNDDYHQLRGGLDLSWKATDALRIKLSGRWQNGMIRGRKKETQNSIYGKLNVNYYWRDFSLNFYGQTQSKGLNDTGIYEWQDGSYGISLNWNYKNWSIEAGTNNPFFTHNLTKYFLNSDVYSYQNLLYKRINQQSGYIKVAYTFDFGKKTSRDSKNVNTNINSAILKAE